MRYPHALLIGLACLTAAACSPKQGEFGDQFLPHGKWEPIPQRADNAVEVVTLDHSVAFSHGKADMTSSARGALGEFIRDNRIGQRDRIAVRAPEETGDSLAAGRLANVKSEFARRGLVAYESDGLGEWPLGAAPGSGEIAVLVTRAVVITPDCSVPPPAPTLRPEHIRGCAVNATLGMMVADPLDLVGGRELGPADGEHASAAMRRYRAGETKELKVEEAFE
jgi:pilus assembly protein CpaD